MKMLTALGDNFLILAPVGLESTCRGSTVDLWTRPRNVIFVSSDCHFYITSSPKSGLTTCFATRLPMEGQAAHGIVPKVRHVSGVKIKAILQR